MIVDKYIDNLLNDIISKEGGYCNHPSDRGGPTCYGVTEQVARANGYLGPMQELPMSTAKDIYAKQYYTSPGFDRVALLSPAIAAELTDTGVNMGPQIAGRLLQTCLNALNRDQKDYPDLVVDGWIGNTTLGCLDKYLKVRAPRGEAVMLKALNVLQGARYIQIAEGDKSQEAFVFGWLAERVSL